VGEGSNYFEYSHLPSLAPLVVSSSNQAPPGTPDSASTAGAGDEDLVLDNDTPVDQVNNICKAHQTKISLALLQHLVVSGQRAEAAWMGSSQFVGSGFWLCRHAGWGITPFILKGQLFRTALRQRAMIPLLFGREIPAVCTCGRQLPGENDAAFHLLHCPHSGWFVTKRHDRIRDRLCELLVAIANRDDSKISDLQKEVPFAAPVAEGERGRVYTADIVVRLAGNATLTALDITVANPAASKYLAVLTIDSATDARGEEKKTLYRKCRADAQFVPFALDATGRLGKEAMKFVDEQTSWCRDLRRPFLDDISLICVTFNGKNLLSRECDEHFAHHRLEM
jgi:hypothetical protein